MSIQVLRGMCTELVPLQEGDERGIELEIIRLDRWANDGRGDARCLQQSIVPQHPIILLAIITFAFFLLFASLPHRYAVASISRLNGIRFWFPWLLLCI